MEKISRSSMTFSHSQDRENISNSSTEQNYSMGNILSSFMEQTFSSKYLQFFYGGTSSYREFCSRVQELENLSIKEIQVFSIKDLQFFHGSGVLLQRRLRAILLKIPLVLLWGRLQGLPQRRPTDHLQRRLRVILWIRPTVILLGSRPAVLLLKMTFSMENTFNSSMGKPFNSYMEKTFYEEDLKCFYGEDLEIFH